MTLKFKLGASAGPAPPPAGRPTAELCLNCSGCTQGLARISESTVFIVQHAAAMRARRVLRCRCHWASVGPGQPGQAGPQRTPRRLPVAKSRRRRRPRALRLAGLGLRRHSRWRWLRRRCERWSCAAAADSATPTSGTLRYMISCMISEDNDIDYDIICFEMSMIS